MKQVVLHHNLAAITPSNRQSSSPSVRQISSISRLPPAILQQIFLSIPLPPIPASLPELTSYILVCGRWRTIINSSPRLWNRYSLAASWRVIGDANDTPTGKNIIILRCALSKSNPAPLHLSLPSFIFTLPQYKPFGAVFTFAISRWTFLKLYFRNPPRVEMKASFAILNNTRALKELTLTFDELSVKTGKQRVVLSELRRLKMEGYHNPPDIVAEKLEQLELCGNGGKMLQVPLSLLKLIEKRYPSLRAIVFHNASDAFVPDDRHPKPLSASTPDDTNAEDSGFEIKSTLYHLPNKHPIRLPSLTTLVALSSSSSSTPLTSMNIYQLLLFGSHKSLTTLHISLEIISGASAGAQPFNFESGVKELWIDATASKKARAAYRHPMEWLRSFSLLQKLEIALCDTDTGPQEAHSETDTAVAVANILLALCGISDPAPTDVLCRTLEGVGCTWVRTPSDESASEYRASKRVGFPYPLSIELDTSSSNPTPSMKPLAQVAPDNETRQSPAWAAHGERKRNLLLYFLAFSWYRSLFPNGKLKKKKESREWGVCSVTLRGWQPPTSTSGLRGARSSSRASEEGEGEDEEREVNGLLRDSRSHSVEEDDEGRIGEGGRRDLIDVSFAEMHEAMEDAGVDVGKVVDLCLGPI